MKRFLRWLFKGQMMERVIPCEWTEEDADQWNAFKASPTGQRLMVLLHWSEQYNCREACLNKDGGDYQRGHAGGYSKAVEFIEVTLSARPVPQTGQPRDGQDGALSAPETRYAP